MFEKFLSVLERIALALEATAAVDIGAVEPAKRGRGRPAKGETTAPESQAASAPPASAASSVQAAQVGAGSASDPVVEKVITLQQVADAIIDLANNHSRDAAVAILAANNVKKVPELKPEQFKGVLDAVAKAKAPQAAPSGSAGLF